MSRIHSSIALVLCVAAIGWAGLWPFEFARQNGVEWLDPGPGMRFEGGGLAYTADLLRWNTDAAPAEFGVEFWLRTERGPSNDLRAIVALLDSPASTVLGVRTQGNHLVAWDRVTNPDGEQWYNDFLVLDVIRPGRLQHVVVTSDGSGPCIYVDGRRVEPRIGYDIRFAQRGERLEGRLVVGAGPPWREPWSGDLLGLVLYDRVPPADAIARRAQLPPAVAVSSIAAESGVVAAYAFDDGGGDLVRDRGTGRHPLGLPAYYRPPELMPLALPDARHWTQLWFAADGVVNLLGFFPLGFLLVLVMSGRSRRAPGTVVLWAGAIGGLLSIGIELSQVVMVSRSSSLVDLVLNTLGSIAGALAAVRRGNRA